MEPLLKVKLAAVLLIIPVLIIDPFTLVDTPAPVVLNVLPNPTFNTPSIVAVAGFASVNVTNVLCVNVDPELITKSVPAPFVIVSVFAAAAVSVASALF